MMKKNDLWSEFQVQVMNDELGLKIYLCGLCGNSGIVDTTITAKWKNKSAGIKAFCICPNGRAIKSQSSD